MASLFIIHPWLLREGHCKQNIFEGSTEVQTAEAEIGIANKDADETPKATIVIEVFIP